MNPNRIHDRKSFYKHTTAKTAHLILKRAKLRWSAPSVFNDPFDVPRDICDGIDEYRLRDALVDRMNTLVENPDLPDTENHSTKTKILLLGFSQADAKLKKQLIEANEKSRRDSSITTQSLDMLRGLWRSQFDEHRILCLTKRWDSASMWDRYSDGHQGVVIELACLDHYDSAWLRAKPVRYTDEPLRLNTTEGFVELMFYDPNYVTAKIMEEYTHTKTKDWEYEREWRVASWKRPHERGDYSEYGFAPEELKGVIFGAKISDQDKRELIHVITTRYPHAELWKASIGSGRRLNREPLQNSEQEDGEGH